MRRMAVALALVLGLSLAGCRGSGSSSDSNDAHSKPTPSPSDSPYPAPALGPLGAPGCKPASPRSTAGDEVEGTPVESDASLYGLIQPPSTKGVHVGPVIKFVWRMTGDFMVTRMIGPDGSVRKPSWGPEEHGGSTYHRPGNEWGTGLRFTKPGCWEIRMKTDTSHASVWLDVKS